MHKNGLKEETLKFENISKDYDDVMNLQRKEIYGLRQRILRGEDLKDEILDQIASTLEEIIFRHTNDGKYPENWALSALYADLTNYLWCYL